jgi:hypothetical protein
VVPLLERRQEVLELGERELKLEAFAHDAVRSLVPMHANARSGTRRRELSSDFFRALGDRREQRRERMTRLATEIGIPRGERGVGAGHGRIVVGRAGGFKGPRYEDDVLRPAPPNDRIQSRANLASSTINLAPRLVSVFRTRSSK